MSENNTADWTSTTAPTVQIRSYALHGARSRRWAHRWHAGNGCCCWQPSHGPSRANSVRPRLVRCSLQLYEKELRRQAILYFKMPSVCLSVSATVSASINPLPNDRLRCCDRYIRCQRSLAVKPLTMSGSPSHRGSVRRVSRSQVTHVSISNCNCWMCAMTVSKLMSTCGNYTSGGDGRCASNGAFSTGVPVGWGLSQRPARVDCGLSYTTGQAIIADCGLCV